MELLAPAGNFEKLVTAVHFGADAVYFAGKCFGLRAFAGNFDNEEIEKAFAYLHERGKKGYVTMNIVAKDSDFENVDEFLNLLCRVKADGVIISDLGLIAYVCKNYPALDVHVSTQANINNSEAANFLAELGVKRIVLARELSIEEIKALRKKVNRKVELEAFVHGAMCISYSGRCLLSNYFTGRDSNRGACVQACRWKYFLREESRNGEYPIEEDERGTYILNSKDLCMIEHLKELEEAGVNSLKIEGRMKSEYYVAGVVNAYRKALDGFEDVVLLKEELVKTSHRRYTTGFYFGAKDKECLESSMPVQKGEFVAKVVDKFNGGVILEQRNRFEEGEILEILAEGELFNKRIAMLNITNENGEKIKVANLVQQRIILPTDLPLNAGDILRR